MVSKKNQLGNVNLSVDVIAGIAGGAATECYGVVGMASKRKMKDGFYSLLGKDNYSRGVITTEGETGIIVDLYIIASLGVKLSEIVYEVQKKVKYVIEHTLDVDVEAVNVYVQSVKGDNE